MPVYNQKKMCPECPFRKKAPKGWLGPWTIEDFKQFIHREGTFVCHVDVARLIDEGVTEDEEIDEAGEHCVGMLRYMNAVCKRSRDPEKAAAQDRVEEIEDQPIIPPFKFEEYHNLHGGYDE